MRISFLSEVPESILYSLPRQEIDRLDVKFDEIDSMMFEDYMDHRAVSDQQDVLDS